MMQSQLKAREKMEMQKSINHLSNTLPALSEVRQILQQQLQYISNQHIQRIHSNFCFIFEEVQCDLEFDNKPFICTQFNRHKNSPDSFRSPYTNNYYPPTQQNNLYPSPILRDLQENGNILFQEYARLYYGQLGCVANFFVSQGQEGLNVMFCLRKEYNDNQMKGIWSSTNFCEIRGDPNKSVTYKLQTSVLYELGIKFEQKEQYVKLSGSLKKNKVQAKKLSPEYQIDEFHLMVYGKLVEQNETFLRQQLESIFLAKSKQICYKSKYQVSRQQEERRVKMGKEFVKMRQQSSKTVELG